MALTGAVVFSYCMGTISSLIDIDTGFDDRFRHRLRLIARARARAQRSMAASASMRALAFGWPKKCDVK